MIRPVGLLLLGATMSVVAQTPCEKLRSLPVPDMSITAAEAVPAGALPAHCRVAAVLAPSADSHIEMEVWLPTPEAWN
jgi:feruloyl esterase